jgi:hypothetical protein
MVGSLYARRDRFSAPSYFDPPEPPDPLAPAPAPVPAPDPAAPVPVPLAPVVPPVPVLPLAAPVPVPPVVAPLVPVLVPGDAEASVPVPPVPGEDVDVPELGASELVVVLLRMLAHPVASVVNTAIAVILARTFFIGPSCCVVRTLPSQGECHRVRRRGPLP